NRFPFGVIYYIKNDEIIILAVMHLRKKPDYFLKRKR
ncbi:plasmid stabilization protein, partial [Aliarcobacter cryaerophilus]